LQKTIGFGSGVGKISRFQPGVTRSKLSVHSPIPMQKEFGSYPAVASLREGLQCLIVFPAIKRRVPCRKHSERPRLNSELFRVGAHADFAEPLHPFEVRSERTQPRFAKNENPWVVPVLLGH